MNTRFFELPEERQAAMRNAGLEVFAKQNYAKASMEEAARLAGVSKALLFHYFENKRGFYLYLYEYATGLDRKSTRLNSSHITRSRMPSSA